MGELDADAAALLTRNTETAHLGSRRFRYSVPSHGQYPFQWFWDSCFHAIVWSRTDPRRAQDELRGLLAWQEPSGFIPHVVFWDRSRIRRTPFHWNYLETQELSTPLPGGRLPRVTRHMQPPVLAQAVERIDGAGGDGFPAEALPALERYYRWLAAARDPDRDGLVSVIAQFESGLDYSPMYDPPVGADHRHPVGIIVRTRWPSAVNKLRYRYDVERILRRARHHQEDVLVNTVYAEGLRALARLAASAGNADLASWCTGQAGHVTEALLERSYDPKAGAFWNLAGPDEIPSRVRTVGSLMPLALVDLPAEVAQRLVESLTDRRHFWTRYPVPSVARSEPSFVPGIHVRGRRLIWRGPLSMNTNWFLVHGLRRHGFGDVAEVIATRSRELVERGGFNEFYDPLTGDPVGQPEFGWATLAVDLS